MKANYLPVIMLTLAVLCGGCATLNKRELGALDRRAFAPLRLAPSVEPNDLRMDIIRQTNVQYYSDEATVPQEQPYHPLGFDLGNGLFFDLNGNLSLRIDSLLGVEANRDFAIVRQEIPKRGRGGERIVFRGDSLTRTFANRRRVRADYHLTDGGDSLAFQTTRGRDYAVVRTDSTLAYRGKWRVWDTVRTLGGDTFAVNNQNPGRHYRLEGERVRLGGRYELERTNGGKTLLVRRTRRNRAQTLFTIERSDERLFVYNTRRSGLKIEFEAGELVIYRNKTPRNRYTVKR